MLPRVALVSNTSLEPLVSDADIATTPSLATDHAGLQVYNLTTANGLQEGIYYWSGSSWRKLIDQLPVITAGYNKRFLQTDQATIAGGGDGLTGIVLNVGTITLTDNGAYAFSVRLYGQMTKTSSDRTIYYISLWRHTTGGDELVDIAEINEYFREHNTQNVSDGITLGGWFDAGDTAFIRICHNSSASNASWQLKMSSTTTPGETSVAWWKIL
jgi:hypothetical protein